jgi:hypothetical protein
MADAAPSACSKWMDHQNTKGGCKSKQYRGSSDDGQGITLSVFEFQIPYK